MVVLSTARPHGVFKLLASVTGAQIEPAQDCPWQLWPHAPQLLPSVVRATHRPPHSTIPATGQPDAPPLPLLDAEILLVEAAVPAPPSPDVTLLLPLAVVMPLLLLVLLPPPPALPLLLAPFPLLAAEPSKFQSSATQLAATETKRRPPP